MKLKPFKVKGLELVSNSLNLRRDIHVFVNYVQERAVKRSHRGNNLSKGDAIRLAKLMSDPEAVKEVKEREDYFSNTWVDDIDALVLQLGFVNYNTEGVYMGYSSVEPSYPDNYVKVDKKAYNKFLALSLQQQEKFILDTLIDNYSYTRNEFLQKMPFNFLDKFDSHGCAVGIMPTIEFATARRFMFKLLKDCQSDVWYSTAALVQYLKSHHPFFLIAAKPKLKKNSMSKGRYANLYEHTGSSWGNRLPVSESDKDAFERVEGRYVERFLEGIPLLLGYVEVAYGDKTSAKNGEELFPALNQLQAFRMKPNFLRVMDGTVVEPKVTVQPNFEIHVESDFYPAQTLNALMPLTNVISEDPSSILLKLNQKKTAVQLATDEHLDIVKLLRHISNKALPANVVTEVEEWAGHSDMFILYDGFGLLEGEAKLTVVNKLMVEQIAPNLRIVKKPSELFVQLEQAELAPLQVRHKNDALCTLPKMAKTVFPKKTVVAKKQSQAKKRKQVTLTKQVMVTIHFPDKELLDIFRKDLLEARCPLEVVLTKQSIIFPQAYEKHVKDTIKRINKEYQIQLKNME